VPGAAIALLLGVAAVMALPGRPVAQTPADTVPRIVAVGDVHGGFDQFVTVLRQAGVIDQRNRWIGGRTQLVQTGDVLDRGADSRKALDLLMALEGPAERAGGRLHALLGNHEVMNVIGDLRYVSEGEYAAFRTPSSEALRDAAFGLLADPARKDDAAYRAAWNAGRPLGWVEHRQAFGPEGRYGRWLRRRDAIARVGGLVFVHGGLSPSMARVTILEINERIRRELAQPAPLEDGFSVDGDGPLWYRGLAQAPEAALAAHVDRLLELLDARHIVIGHTILAPAIIPRFNGKVIAIDVGLSPVYGGPPACLLVENGRLYALHRGQRVALPEDGNLRPYLERLAAIDPAPSPLRGLIDRLAPLVPVPA
jgi:hypothetical protein